MARKTKEPEHVRPHLGEMARPLKFTYYGPKERVGREWVRPVVKITRGSRISEALPNVSRYLTRHNPWGAEVCEVHDEASFNEVLLVATYLPGEKFDVVFTQDATRPVCIVDYDK